MVTPVNDQNGKLQKKRSNSQQVHLLNFLRETAPGEYNPKTLSKALGIPYSNTRTYLTRLCKKGKIKRPYRGFYRATIDEKLIQKLGNPPIQFHGIKIEATLQKAIDGITPEIISKLLTLGFEEKTNNRYCTRIYFKGRPVTLTIHGKGFVEIFIKSSDKPLSAQEFEGVINFLNGFMHSISPLANRKLVQIGMNRDFMDVRLDGLKSGSLKVASNALARVYEHKSNGLRTEMHLETCIGVDEAIEILLKMFPDS